MAETRKSTFSVWKKIKTVIKSFTKGKKKIKPVDTDSIHTHTDEEIMNEQEEQSWVAASPYTGEYGRKSLISSFLNNVELNAETDTERIAMFVKEATGEVQEWWCQLTVKPSRWDDLKNWITEDMDSVEGIQRIRREHENNSKYY
ncbi:hypothetical protein NEIG_00484 [Nematocida sp. ERTm5]|nr:hypothetical protein NEIG_00484 [Nematocida sp. ERTm5]